MDIEFERENAAAGFDRERRLLRDAMIVNEFRDTTDAVAAHLALAAVGVEHAHAGVGFFRWANEDEPIRADAEMAVADDFRQGDRVFRSGLANAIDIDVVVAGALHFGEAHASSSRIHSNNAIV